MTNKLRAPEQIQDKDRYIRISEAKRQMLAMLEELRLEFEEYEPKWVENEDQAIASNRTWDDFDDIIQQKINNLQVNNSKVKDAIKEHEDGQTNN